MKSKDKSKPLMLYVAEEIYINISNIKKTNPDITLMQAIEIFLLSKELKNISSGEFHKKLYKELADNNFINKDTNTKINNETLRLLKVQEEAIIKSFKAPNDTYFAKSSFPLSNTQKAFDLLWRMCESYELWCKEVKKEKLITLNILD